MLVLKLSGMQYIFYVKSEKKFTMIYDLFKCRRFEAHLVYKKGRKRPLDTPKRVREREERETERER